MSGEILPLNEVVRSQLRSGITITSVAQCVEELVLNSLDAKATYIAVRINFTTFKIQVVDNGHGIKERDLKYLGTRHATSKCHSLKDLSTNLCHYGFRGEALASTVDLSAIVDISTKPRDDPRTYSKLFTYGKEKMIGAAKSSRPSVGTTITIQDFMYNMPVRRKIIKEAIDIENVRKRLESFALMNPKVSFSLRNDNTNAVILHTKKTTCCLSVFMQLFSSERAQGLAEVEHSLDQFSINGYISIQPHINKSMQFMYVNKRVILKTKIHKMLNFLLARSSIISSRIHPGSLGSGKPSSPVKGMRLYGIFFLNIECPHSEYDICLDPNKTLVEFRDWDKLLICIEEMFLKFIKEENLAVSLNERFRKSGKSNEGEEEDEEEVKSSMSQLEVFSLKRPGNKEEPGASEPKYGRSICTQDNLLAVHSLPVRRVKKKIFNLDNLDEEKFENQPNIKELRSSSKDDVNCNSKNDNEIAEKNTASTSNLRVIIQDFYSSPSAEVKRNQESSESPNADDNIKAKRSVLDSLCETYRTDLSPESSNRNEDKTTNEDEPSSGSELLTPSYKSNKHTVDLDKSNEDLNGERNSCSDENDSENMKEPIMSTLDQFKRTLDKCLDEGDTSVRSPERVKSRINAESVTNLERPKPVFNAELLPTGNIPIASGSPKSVNSQDETKTDRGLSTLEKFVKFCEEDNRKAEMEMYQTPIDALKHTPSTPPRLRASKRVVYAPDIQDYQNPSCDSLISPEDTEAGNRQEKANVYSKRCLDKSKSPSGKLGDIVTLDDVHDNMGPSEKRNRQATDAIGTKRSTLSKALSEKFRKYQCQSKTSQTLKQFEYSQTKVISDCEQRSFKNPNLCPDETMMRKSKPANLCEDSGKVNRDLEERSGNETQEENCKDSDILDSSFRFQPVIASRVAVITDDDVCLFGTDSGEDNSSDTRQTNCDITNVSELSHKQVDSWRAHQPTISERNDIQSRYNVANIPDLSHKLVNSWRACPSAVLERNSVNLCDVMQTNFEVNYIPDSSRKPVDPLRDHQCTISDRNSYSSNAKRANYDVNSMPDSSQKPGDSCRMHQSTDLSERNCGNLDCGIHPAAPDCMPNIVREKQTDHVNPSGIDIFSKPRCPDHCQSLGVGNIQSSGNFNRKLIPVHGNSTQQAHVSHTLGDHTSIMYEPLIRVPMQSRVRETSVENHCTLSRNATNHLPLVQESQRYDIDSPSAVDISSTQPFEVMKIVPARTDSSDQLEEGIQESQGFTLQYAKEHLCKEAHLRPNTATHEPLEHSKSASQESQGFQRSSIEDLEDITELLNNIDNLPKEREVTKFQDTTSSIIKAPVPFDAQHQQQDFIHSTPKITEEGLNSTPNRNDGALKSTSNCNDEGLRSTDEPQHIPLQEKVVNNNTENWSQSQEQGEVNSSASSSPNPFSETLHFSQLTFLSQDNNSATTTDPLTEKLDTAGTNDISLPTSSDSGSEKVKKMKPCEITFHGKIIHIGKDATGIEKSKENNFGDIHFVNNIESLPLNKDSLCSGDSCEETSTTNIVKKSSPVIEEVREVRKEAHLTVCEASHNLEVVQKPQAMQGIMEYESPHSRQQSDEEPPKSQSKEQGLESENAGQSSESLITNQSAYNNSSEPLSSSHPASRWKEAVDNNGKKVYVDLQTGNTSYDPPPVIDQPQWTCSQSLGAPLLKVPLTHEPGFIPPGNGMKLRENFTLSHGYSDLLSWKKTREAKKEHDSCNDLHNSITSTGINNIPNNEMSDNDCGSKPAAPSSEEIRETINAFMKDLGTEDTSKDHACPDEAQLSDVAQICQGWEAPDFAMDAEILNTGADQITTAERGRTGKRDAMVKVYNVVHPYRFTKDMLRSCKVLCQVDEKYIACSLTYPWSTLDHSNPTTQNTPAPARLLVLFDQHAVHERIRLEAITRDNFETVNSQGHEEGDSDEGAEVLTLRYATVAPPMKLSLPRHEVRLMIAFTKVFNHRGLHFSQVDDDVVSFYAIPSCLVAREASEARHRRCQLAATIVESTVRDLCHTLQCTGGAVPAIPTPISNVLNSQACRGAVKFGDSLSKDQCEELITSLSSCQLPFQCAHGRPSIMPIINLAHLPPSQQKSKPNLWKVRDALRNS